MTNTFLIQGAGVLVLLAGVAWRPVRGILQTQEERKIEALKKQVEGFRKQAQEKIESLQGDNSIHVRLLREKMHRMAQKGREMTMGVEDYEALIIHYRDIISELEPLTALNPIQETVQ